MKKKLNRLFAVVMVMAMLVSNSMVVSAAEFNEKELANETCIGGMLESISEVGMKDYVETDAENGIVAYSDYINQSGNGMANGSKFHDSFVMSRKEKLVTKLNVTGICRMVIKLKSGIFTATLFDETVTNGQFWKITGEYVNSGVTVDVTLYFSGSSTNYSLRMWGE